MNPIKKMVSEYLAKGDTVISLFSDSSSAGIIVRLKDGTEITREIEDGDPREYQKWIVEASFLLTRGFSAGPPDQA